jgi:ABC-type glycerol-3-phosphate transport system substrate-binding protein
MRTTSRCVAAGVAAVLLLAGCSQSDDPAVDATVTTPSTAATTATTATTVGPAPATTAAPTTVAARGTVSANNASRTELQAAFTAAGISSPAQWAREVEEYRPYPTDDPDLAKLRGELAKYNPGPGVVDQIVATLALP